MAGFLDPPRWTDRQLLASSDKAIDNFILLRRKESQTLYADEWTACQRWVTEIFTASNNLRTATPDLFLPDDPTKHGTDRNGHERIGAFRYLSGVPISADDLRTMVEDPLGKRVLPNAVRSEIWQSVEIEFDPMRLPWITLGRDPTKAERTGAIYWTAGLMAMERRRTARRQRASSQQESCVRKLLQHCGFTAATPAPKRIDLASHVPEHTFCTETKVADAKCDVPARLGDGRLLAIECKSSNSAVNSIKRLNRETGGKANLWNSKFGDAVIPAAVIAGVFSLTALREAQDSGIAIFWQHDLRPLIDFIKST
jgi:hypothetical protein